MSKKLRIGDLIDIYQQESVWKGWVTRIYFQCTIIEIWKALKKNAITIKTPYKQEISFTLNEIEIFYPSDYI